MIEETRGMEYKRFQMSSWGRMHACIPWEELSSLLPRPKGSKKGPSPYFSEKGMLALMFLKHQTGLSDEKLIEHINHSPSLQLFCFMRLEPHEMIRDTGIVSRIRGYLSRHIDMDSLQDILVSHWSEDLSWKSFMKVDATCMESYIRYPTDTALLWECCQWVYGELFAYRRLLGIPLGKPKERLDAQRVRYSSYSKLRRKPRKRTRSIKKSLLNLLSRGIGLIHDLMHSHFPTGGMPTAFYSRLSTCRKVLEQHQQLFKDPKAKVKHRVVSLHKPYLRPIKRGKQRKPTEFGAKVQMIQVDGLCIIETFSWEAFHEGIRLEAAIKKHEGMFGKCTHVSADGIYGTNANRRMLAKKSIQAGFVGKGRKPRKAIRVLRSEMNKDRATRLEGSFGNQKNHYGLMKVKARNQYTEKLWIYFGVFTSNAVWIANKRREDSQKAEKLAA